METVINLNSKAYYRSQYRNSLPGVLAHMSENSTLPLSTSKVFPQVSSEQSHPGAPHISVIIPNWNGAPVLGRCLAALAAQTCHDYEVIIVDNRSTDGSAVGLEERWSSLDLRVVSLSENVGFAAANNLGARLARGRWLALLNNDAFPAPDWLERLLAAADAHPEFAFFASRLIRANDQTLLDGAGDAYHISGLAWRRYHDQLAAQKALDVEEVFGPCAAAALYSRDLFLRVGGFDEDYFMYHEDVDLSFRARLQGGRCLYVPQAVVHHVGSATLGRRSDFAIYYGHRNLVWGYVKNMPGALFWWFLPAHILTNLLAILYYSLAGHCRAIWRAKIDALRGLGAVLRKRREVQRTRRVSIQEIAQIMDHGWLSPYTTRIWHVAADENHG